METQPIQKAKTEEEQQNVVVNYPIGSTLLLCQPTSLGCLACIVTFLQTLSSEPQVVLLRVKPQTHNAMQQQGLQK